MLAAYNLRLHKIVSNDLNVTQAFSKERKASDLHDRYFSQDTILMQCTLGVLWDVLNVAFTFQFVWEQTIHQMRCIARHQHLV